MRDIFARRVAFKPFEYPEVLEYKAAINHSFWLVGEFNFLGDVQDFGVRLDAVERNAVKNALLAISQVEVSVKRFWTRLGDRFPKAEFEQVGVVFGESEVRHADAYSHLLQVLDLNDDFAQLLEVPAIRARVGYLSDVLAGASATTDEQFALVLALFAMFIENVSLFSQFVVIKSFNKYRNVLKDIDNVVQATQKEEAVHALFGAYLINQIRSERPGWFGPEFYGRLRDACLRAFEAEVAVVDWIFEAGELPFLTKALLVEFLKKRFNESLAMIGGEPAFEVDRAAVGQLRWFEDEILADVNTDFFHKKPVTYSKKVQAIQAEDLF
jgi:ribonucleoside-diphosphate reductase beta chain